jgi:hypothetical protein
MSERPQPAQPAQPEVSAPATSGARVGAGAATGVGGVADERTPDFRLPALTAETRAFWTSGSRGALEICRCGDCDLWIHPPQPVCPACRSFAVEA